MLCDLNRLRDDADYKAVMRRRCQTDLLFLARALGYDKVIDRVHGPVAALYLQKNPDVPLGEWDTIKQRLHLDPRKTFKTSMAIADNVQTIIATGGDCRICKLTATKPLAKAVVGEITDHFVKSPMDDGTMFQQLFSEFCIAPRERVVNEFTAPCRPKNWKDKTVMGFSIETSISGWHFDVLDVDDVVDTQNSKGMTGLEMVKTNYRINKKTLMPWGYVNFKGTRYHPLDLWGDIIDKAKPGKIKMLIRSALKRKDGARLTASEFPAREECDVLFPELLNYDFLQEQFEEDFSSYMTQYQNDAYGDKEIVFSKEAMLAASLPAEQMPIAGQVHIAWRFAYSGKWRFAAGAAGVIDNNRLYIVDVVRGQFTPSNLAHRVVQLAKKHGAHSVAIEETPGARALEPAIKNYALTMGWSLSVQWSEFQMDDGERDGRIKGVEPLLATGRLQFNADLAGWREAYRQITNYGMVEETEIPDAISRVALHLPQSIANTSLDASQDMAWELMRQRDMYDRTHGLGRYAPPAEVVAAPRPQPQGLTAYGLPDELGGLNG